MVVKGQTKITIKKRQKFKGKGIIFVPIRSIHRIENPKLSLKNEIRGHI